MLRTASLSATLLLLALLAVFAAAKVDDAGFGSKYLWHSLDDGLLAARDSGKPAMVLIHKSWCGACKALKPQFAASSAIEKLSQQFVMIIAGDDDEPADPKFAEDGKYVPRIYFLDSEGAVIEGIKNEQGNPNYKHFYPTPDGIVASMSKALKAKQTRPASQEEL
ncbi:thioredoxin domain-containing protein 12-like [Cloeon dipterum]|uniref:thioredoxin domain-containing protein 12-like n=1 Tax=Cloeon dipterum TaxID=197152 RepID=UPI00321FCC85